MLNAAESRLYPEQSHGAKNVEKAVGNVEKANVEKAVCNASVGFALLTVFLIQHFSNCVFEISGNFEIPPNFWWDSQSLQ